MALGVPILKHFRVQHSCIPRKCTHLFYKLTFKYIPAMFGYNLDNNDDLNIVKVFIHLSFMKKEYLYMINTMTVYASCIQLIIYMAFSS